MNTTSHEVPVDHLDYPYIKKCTDVKELEKIVKILRSGKEGKYPDLEDTAEKRLEELNPKSKVLIKEQPIASTKSLPKSDQKNIFDDLDAWSSDIKSQESGLQEQKFSNGDLADDNLPPVRGSTIITGSKSSSSQAGAKKSSQRRDWKDWDKVDIDAELAKVDSPENEAKPHQQSSVLRSKPNIPETLPSAGLTDDEKRIKAEKEKEKGNEAFRSGDYSEAVLYYTRSLSLNNNVAARNNRAQAYLKLERWDSALTDVETVLECEPENVKAYLRRGVARQGKREYVEARDDIQRVLQMEPNNKKAKGVLEEIEKALEQQKVKGRRMVIEESDGSDDEEIENDTPQPSQATTTEKANIEDITVESANSNKQSVKIEDITVEMDTTTINNITPPSKTEDIAMTECQTKSNQNEETNNTKPSDSVEIMNTDDTENIVSAQKCESKSSVTDNTDSSDEEMVIINKKSKRSQQEEKSTDTTSHIKEDSISSKIDESKKEELPVKAAPVVEEVVKPVAPPPLPIVVVKLKDSGNELFKAGRYPDAITKYTNAINKIEDNPLHAVSISVLYSNRAACKHKIGDCYGSIEDCNIALSLNPGAVKPLLRRATAYETLEKFRHAYVDFQQIVLTERNAEIAQQGAARCQRILVEQDGSKWRDKLPAMSPMADSRVTPLLFPPPTIAAGVPATTIEYPRKLSEEERTEAYEREKEKGNEFVKRGKFQFAVDCYNRCIALDSEVTVAYTNRALCYLRLDKPEEVLKDCDKVFTIEPGNVKALFRKAQAHKMLKQYEESMENLELLLSLDKNNSAAKREVHVVQKYIGETKAKMPQPETKRKKITIQEVSSSDSEEEQQPTTTPSKLQPKMSSSKTNKDSEKVSINNSADDENVNNVTPTNTGASVNTGSSSTNKPSSKTPPSKQHQGGKSNKKRSKKGKKQQQHVLTSNKGSSSPASSPDVGSPPPVAGGEEQGSEPTPLAEASGVQKDTVVEQDKSKKAGSIDTQVKYDLKAPKTTSKIKATAGLMGSKTATAPKLEKASAFEFVSAWTSLKNVSDVDQYLDLLQQVQPDKLPSVISNKLEGNMLNRIVQCVDKLCDQGKNDVGYKYLQSLTQVPRFEMNTLFMSGTDKQELKKVVDKLKPKEDSTYNTADLDKLKKKYGL